MLSIEEKYLRLTVYAFYPLLLYVLRFTLFTGAHFWRTFFRRPSCVGIGLRTRTRSMKKLIFISTVLLSSTNWPMTRASELGGHDTIKADAKTIF